MKYLVPDCGVNVSHWSEQKVSRCDLYCKGCRRSRGSLAGHFIDNEAAQLLEVDVQVRVETLLGRVLAAVTLLLGNQKGGESER
jgi:hypothetical protein